MRNELAIKTYKMDYDFLLKNHLNPEMWTKKWTLFEYKTFTISLYIWSIQTYNEQVFYEITLHHRDLDNKLGDTETSQSLFVSFQMDNPELLKRQIASAAYECIVKMEKEHFIPKLQEYKDLLELKIQEKEKLKAICNEFLDDNNITNENIRDAYTDAYIEENGKVIDLLLGVINRNTYSILTDLYITFLDSLDNDPKTKIRKKEIYDKIGKRNYDKVIQEIEEFKKAFGTEEYINDMKNNLEEIQDVN